MSCKKIQFFVLCATIVGTFFACHSSPGRDESPPKRLRPACPPPVFETPERGHQMLSKELKKAIEIGIRAKLLANVYLGDDDSKANIFVPVISLHFKKPDGTLEEETHFVRSDKKKICLFASGGGERGHVWEKGIHQIYPLLFGERIKVIRAGWLAKHLLRDFELPNTADKSPEDLHSEIFWKTYVHYFLPVQLSPLMAGRHLDHMEVHAFSWWDVCDGCHAQLPYEYAGVPLFYKIVSSRPYEKHYKRTPEFQFSFLKGIKQERKEVLKDTFDRIMGLAQLYDDQPKKEKKAFWTTYPGVEAAKWLGHTFHRENPLLKEYLGSIPESSVKSLEDLLSYLKKENWELSCYQKKPRTFSIQKAWESHWGQRVIPHFGWTSVAETLLEERNGVCEMCGKEGLADISFVYHSKHRGTAPTTTGGEEQGDGSGDDELDIFIRESRIDFSEKNARRKKSLTVGSECVKYMTVTKTKVMDQRKKQKENAKKMNSLKEELGD